MKLGYPSLKTSWARHRGEAAYPWMWHGLIGAWSFMEGMGDKAYDRSGYGNHGTLVGGPMWSNQSAENAGSLSVDGVNDHVSLGTNVGNFAYTDSFTISAWIKSNLGGTHQIIYGNAWDSTGYHIRVTNANKIRFILIKDGSNYNGYDSNVITSNWNHVVGVWEGSGTPKIYINGANDSQTAATEGIVTTITTANATNIGRSNDADGQSYFRGLLDDVRIYNRALSAAEVFALWNLGPKSLHVLRRTQIAFSAAGNWSWLHHLTNSPYGIAK